jgi:glucosylceramidase
MLIYFIMKLLNTRYLFTISLGAVFFLFGCKDEGTLPPDPPPVITDIGKANVWLTTGDQLRLLNKETQLPIRDYQSGSFSVITIDTTVTYQKIRGFGAAMTGSSAYNLNSKMSVTTKETALKMLFDPETGIGISYIRLTMGASDFSLSDFSYDDMPQGQSDEDLSEFSLDHDMEDVVPVMKDVLAINPDIGIIGSPWSAPAWMKTNNNMKGGKLKTSSYPIYANYFVKYIEAMRAEGIPVSAVTIQNEPLYFTAGYPCMEMQADEQNEFIKNHLGPAFTESNLNTEIVVYDHNWDNTNYAISILNDAETRQYVTGSAFHAYGGNVSAMNTVHSAHPDKELYFTEISGGDWATDFGDNLLWNMKNIFIGTTKNWSSVALLWNLVLDQNHGPSNNGCSDCRGVITYNNASGQLIYNEEYYSIGHMSKFVRPGALRVSSRPDQSIMNMDVVAFINTDNSKVLVLANYKTEFQTFTVKQGKKHFNYSIAPESVATIVWN